MSPDLTPCSFVCLLQRFAPASTMSLPPLSPPSPFLRVGCTLVGRIQRQDRHWPLRLTVDCIDVESEVDSAAATAGVRDQLSLQRSPAGPPLCRVRARLTIEGRGTVVVLGSADAATGVFDMRSGADPSAVPFPAGCRFVVQQPHTSQLQQSGSSASAFSSASVASSSCPLSPSSPFPLCGIWHREVVPLWSMDLAHFSLTAVQYDGQHTQPALPSAHATEAVASSSGSAGSVAGASAAGAPFAPLQFGASSLGVSSEFRRSLMPHTQIIYSGFAQVDDRQLPVHLYLSRVKQAEQQPEEKGSGAGEAVASAAAVTSAACSSSSSSSSAIPSQVATGSLSSSASSVVHFHGEFHVHHADVLPVHGSWSERAGLQLLAMGRLADHSDGLRVASATAHCSEVEDEAEARSVLCRASRGLVERYGTSVALAALHQQPDGVAPRRQMLTGEWKQLGKVAQFRLYSFAAPLPVWLGGLDPERGRCARCVRSSGWLWPSWHGGGRSVRVGRSSSSRHAPCERR